MGPEPLRSRNNFINNLVCSATPPTCSPPNNLLHHNNNFTAIADTGASQHYCVTNSPVPNRDYQAPKAVVGLADGSFCESMAKASLALPGLPPGTTACHIMPSFVNNLLSIGVFCDADCNVTFTKQSVNVTNKAGTVILTGYREPIGARMWRFNLEPPWHPLQRKLTLACNATTPSYQLPQAHLIPNDDDDDSIQPYLPPVPPSVPA